MTDRSMSTERVLASDGSARVNLNYESGETPYWAKVSHQPRTNFCTW